MPRILDRKREWDEGSRRPRAERTRGMQAATTGSTSAGDAGSAAVTESQAMAGHVRGRTPGGQGVRPRTAVLMAA